VENRKGDIFDPHYLEVLRKVSDEVFYIEGVDRNRSSRCGRQRALDRGHRVRLRGSAVMPTPTTVRPRASRRCGTTSCALARWDAWVERHALEHRRGPIFDKDRSPASSSTTPLFRRSWRSVCATASGRRRQGAHRRFRQDRRRPARGVTAIFLFALITIAITSFLLFLYTRTSRRRSRRSPAPSWR